jgi:hypothetical protein
MDIPSLFGELTRLAQLTKKNLLFWLPNGSLNVFKVKQFAIV